MIANPNPAPKTARRRFLVGTVPFAALLMGHPLRGSAKAAPDTPSPIVQPPQDSDAAFIGRAFEMRDLAVAEGDQPYGAVVVGNGRIVGQARSHVVTGHDPTAHAEMEAIRDAARRLGRRDLSGAVLYSSSRPCPMCEAAAYWAGVGRLVYGAGATDGGAPAPCR